MVETVFSFLLIMMMITSQVYAKCRSEEDSYKRYVEPVKGYSKEDGARLKKHLKCWKDKEVMIKLAKIYIYRKDFYLAKQVYIEAGAEKEAQLVDVILKDHDTHENKNEFMQQSLKISEKFRKNAKTQKQIAVTFSILGPLFAVTGLGLFIYERAFDGNSPKALNYALMFGGLSLLGGGITINYFSDYNEAKAETYTDIANNHYEAGATPDQYYEFSENELMTRKKMIKKLRIHGASLITLSIPLFVISAFSMYDAYKWFLTGKPLSDDMGSSIVLGLITSGLVAVAEIATLGAGIIFLSGGISMITYSYRWQKTDKPTKVIELTNIAPIINPISKTYGLALGFSF